MPPTGQGSGGALPCFPAGTLQFEIGIQTFDMATQRRISRRQDNAAAVALCRDNSVLAQMTTVVSICLLNGYAMFPEAKSHISAFAATVANLCGGFIVGISKHYETDERFAAETTEEELKPKKWKRYVKLGVIPVVIAMAFYIIFSYANPVFGKIAEQFNEVIFDFFERIFSGWTIERVAFTLLGVYLVAAVLYHWLPEFFCSIQWLV